MSRKKHIFFIVLCGLLVYLNSLRNNFVWDDILVIVNNDFIKGPALLGELFSKPLFYLTNNEYLYYRPLLGLSYVFDYSLWGLNPAGFHLTNLLLHICAGILLYELVDILLNDQGLAFCAGFFFILHPVNTSVVNYITSRADILAAIFIISASILFLKAKNYRYYLLSLFCFALALLSKEVVFIFPLFLIFAAEMKIKIRQALPGDGFEIKKVRIWYLAFMAVLAAYVFLRVKILGVGFNLAASGEIGLPGILVNFSMILLNYMKLIYLPLDLHMLRNIPIIQTQVNTVTLSLLLAMILAAAFIVYRLDKTVFFLAGFFIIWVSPVALLSLKNPEYFIQHCSILEEHWLYLPAAGAVTLTFYLIRKMSKGYAARVYGIVFISFAVFLSVATVRANACWKNNMSLFNQTLRYVKNSTTAYRNMGWIYTNRNDLPSAIKMYVLALGLKQTDKTRAVLYKDLGLAYILINDAEKAGWAAQEAIKISPDYAASYGLLGLLYAHNDPARSRQECKKALEIDPFEPAAFNNLLEASSSNKEISGYLIGKYKEALKGSYGFDAHKIYRSLGIAYLYAGEEAGAIANLKNAGRINPYDSKASNALAICYVKKGDFVLAEKLFKKALRFNPFDKEVYLNLALFYTDLGRDKEALLMRQKAYSVNLFE